MHVDLHNHLLSNTFLDDVRTMAFPLAARLEESGGALRLIHDQGYGYPLSPELYDVEAKIESSRP